MSKQHKFENPHKGHREKPPKFMYRPYYPPDIENTTQLLQCLQLKAETTSNSVFDLSTNLRGTKPYWVVSKNILTIPHSIYSRTVKACDMILLIEMKLVRPIGMSSNEFLAQHALGTLTDEIKISVEPRSTAWIDAEPPDNPDEITG